MNNELTRAEIVSKVAELSSKCFGTKITEQDIKGRGRTRELVISRMACSILLLKERRCSLESVGMVLNRDHSTIINHRQQFKNSENDNGFFATTLKKLMNKYVCPEFNITLQELYSAY